MLKQVQHDMKRIKKSHHKHNFSFVIASVSEAISNKLKDCHVAIAPRNDVTVWRNSAFTLAEILITLAIIGVVSAMTIPTLIAKTQQKQMTSKLMKTYSTLNQAYKMSLEENGSPSDAEALSMGNEEYFNKYWAPYLKGVKYLNYKDMGYTSIQPFLYLNGTKNSFVVTASDVRTSLSLADGVYAIITVGYTKDKVYVASSYIVVDLNGPEKPNTYGKDVFMFLKNDKYIKTYCQGSSVSTINSNCSKIGVGTCCADKIKNNGWKVPSDYPW